MTHHQQVEKLDECKKLAEEVLPPRYVLLDRLDRYVEGTQYEGKPDWSDDNVPIADRSPCITFASAGLAIESYKDLLVGQHRQPVVKTKKPGEDEAAPLTKSKAKFARFMRKVAFRSVLRELIDQGLSCGTAVAILGEREGHIEGRLDPFIDTVPAKWCTPTFKPGTSIVTALVIEYPYIDIRQDDRGKWHAKLFAYHREVTAEYDRTAKPVEIIKGQAFNWSTITWSWNPDQSIERVLPRCPVIWWARDRGASVEGRIDGKALHGTLLDEITQLDIALSLRQDAAIFAGQPQWTEIGVEPGYNPTEGGAPMNHPATPSGGPLGKNQVATAHYRAPVSSNNGFRKKGPKRIWQYESSAVQVELHQLGAGALDALDKNARDLYVRICDMMACVLLDPERLPNLGSLSGEAQEKLRQKQLARCDTMRDDVADNLLIPLVCMLAMLLDGEALDPDEVAVDWPPYTKPTKTEKAQFMQAVVTAISAAIAAVPSPSFKTRARMALVEEVLDDMDEEEREEILKELEDAEKNEPLELPGEEQQPPPPGKPGVVKPTQPRQRPGPPGWGGPA